MGLLVTVLGTHAGAGASTVAVNLAAVLTDGGSRMVRLVELDDSFGHLAADLAVEPASDVVDAAILAAGPRGLGAHDQVGSMLTPIAPGLTGLLHAQRRSAGGSAALASRLHGPATARLLEAVRAGADVVVDAPATFDDPVVTALAMSDRVVVVTSPEGPAVEALNITLDSIALMHVPTERVSLVLNHVTSGGGAADSEGLPVVAVPPTAVVPDCPDLEAGTALVALSQPDHPLTRAVHVLAQALRAAEGPGTNPQPTTGRRRRRRQR